VSVRINLLPHRELRRERRKKDFVLVAGLVVILAVAAALAVGLVIDRQIENQRARNEFIAAEIAALDAQIGDIARLRTEIEALRARQAAVETLQSNRTIPVRLADELVQRMPEGAFLKSLRQDGDRLTLIGLAQSNERISDFLRALAQDAVWLERPELLEIKAVELGAAQVKGTANGRQAGASRRVYEFSIKAAIRGTEATSAPGVPAGAARPALARAGASTAAPAPGATAARN
jgi:type IV pilus assembly protein PilN